MDKRESKSELTFDDLLKEAANVLVPPSQEEWELTYKDIAKITGRDDRSCKYYLEKYFKQGTMKRRKVVCRLDGTVQFAYSPQRGNTEKDWKELIELMKE